MDIFLLYVFLILLVTHVSIRFGRKGRLIDNIPGPIALPILGNLLQFNLSPEEIWKKLLKLLDKYYPTFRIWGFRTPGVFIRHPDDIKILLTCKKNIMKSKVVYENIKFLQSDGLFSSSGEKWHQRRRVLNLAFYPKCLKFYSGIIDRRVKTLVEDLTGQGKELIFDVVPVFNRLAFEIIWEVVMGTEANNISIEDKKEFLSAMEEIGKIVLWRATKIYIQDWMMKFLKMGKRLNAAAFTYRNLIKKTIQQRMEYHKLKGMQQSNDSIENFESNDGRFAVLDLLLMSKKKGLMDDQGVLEEVETIIVAGYDTSGLAMTYTLLLLAENKMAQDLARIEAERYINNCDDNLNAKETFKLEYIERCIKESLRLIPPGAALGRFITEELHLKNFTLPASTEIATLIFATHRDPNFWSEPTKFNPDRFLPENLKNQHSFAYVPFSAGLRNCIGQKFAMNELRCTIAHILYSFQLQSIDSSANLEFSMNITLKPKNPIRIKFIKIER